MAASQGHAFADSYDGHDLGVTEIKKRLLAGRIRNLVAYSGALRSKRAGDKVIGRIENGSPAVWFLNPSSATF
jgi:hypothetical protein